MKREPRAAWLRTIERTGLTDAGHRVVAELEGFGLMGSAADEDRYYDKLRKNLLMVALVERAARRGKV